MSIVSHLYHLFNAETFQSYIHTLCWKDRPRPCPRCQRQDIDPWGNGGKCTFDDLTDTMMHQCKRSLPYWMLAAFLLCLSCSSRCIANELGVHVHTGYRWCWWLCNAPLSYEMDCQLEVTVEADEFYHTAEHEGQAKESRELLSLFIFSRDVKCVPVSYPWALSSS